MPLNVLRLLGVYEEDDRPGGSKGRKSATWVGGKSTLSEGISELFGNVRQLVFDQWGQKMHYLDITKVCREIRGDFHQQMQLPVAWHLQPNKPFCSIVLSS